MEASSIPSDPKRRKPDDQTCCDSVVEPSTGDGVIPCNPVSLSFPLQLLFCPFLQSCIPRLFASPFLFHLHPSPLPNPARLMVRENLLNGNISRSEDSTAPSCLNVRRYGHEKYCTSEVYTAVSTRKITKDT